MIKREGGPVSYFLCSINTFNLSPKIIIFLSSSKEILQEQSFAVRKFDVIDRGLVE